MRDVFLNAADPRASADSHWIWWPTTVMMLGTLLSYVDRASLALLSPMFLGATHMTAQDYSWCISAFSSEQMDAQGVRDIDAIARLTPGITFQRTDARNTASRSTRR